MGGIGEEGMSAEEYYRYCRGRGPSRYVKSLCRRYLTGEKTRAVLEVGCGAGFALRQITHTAGGGFLLVGCDIDRDLLRYAAETNDSAPVQSVALVCNGAGSLPFAGGAFDVVFSETSLHHFDRPREMLAEMWRALKPGGSLVVVDLNPESPFAAAYAAYVRVKSKAGLAGKGELALARSIHHAFREKETASLFAELGVPFSVSKVRASITFEAAKPAG